MPRKAGMSECMMPYAALDIIDPLLGPLAQMGRQWPGSVCGGYKVAWGSCTCA